MTKRLKCRVAIVTEVLQDRSGEIVPASGWEQYRLELAKADAASIPGLPTIAESSLC